jgi:uncharacterized protein (DUF2236 family)
MTLGSAESPASRPPGTESPAARPPGTESPAARPPGTESPAGESPVSGPPGIASPVSESRRSPADGLFGPDSVTWRIMGEPIIWVAGFRALYLQALHPRAMRGTWQNTSFNDREQAWGRFVRTAEFVRVRTYGSRSEVERAGRRIRKIHHSLTGVDADGSTIRLDEAELLLWVHCGEVASYVDIARRSGMGLSRADLDSFVDEQRLGAAVVGIDPATAPASVAELNAYYEQMRPRLHACAEAKDAFRTSYHPPMPAAYLPLKLVVPPLNTLAFATLPRWARRLYGAPGSPLTDIAATAALVTAYQSSTRIPRQLLFLPVTMAARRRSRAQDRDRAA